MIWEWINILIVWISGSEDLPMPETLPDLPSHDPRTVLLLWSVFWISLIALIAWITLHLLQSSVIPWIIQKAVQELPLDKDMRFNSLTIAEFTPDGYNGSVDLEILHSKPLFSWISLQVIPTSPLIIYDALTDRPILQVSCFQPINVTGKHDLRIVQGRVEVNIVDLQLLKELARRLCASEEVLQKTSVRIECRASFDFWNSLLFVHNLKLDKTINFGVARAQQASARAKRGKRAEEIRSRQAAAEENELTGLMNVSESEIQFAEKVEGDYGIHSLLPHPIFTPLPVAPSIGSIVGGLDINFASPPLLNLSIPVVKFKIKLNGSNIAEGVVQGLIVDPESSRIQTSIHLSSIVTSQPIKGFASTARGILRGALTGALNGLLFGEWGAGSSVVGLSEIELHDGQGKRVYWLEAVLEALEMEKDLEALKRLRNRAGQAASNVKDGFANLSASLLDAAGRCGSKCSVM